MSRQRRDLQAGQLARGGGPGLDSIVAGFESRMSELEDHLGAVADRIAVTTDTAVTDALADRGPASEAELTGLLAPAALAPDGAVTGPETDPVPGALDALRLAGRQAAGDWLERRAAELREALIAAAAEDIGVLLDLARSPRELGAAIAGLPVFDSAPAGWAAEEIPQLTVPGVDWTVLDPPARRRRRRGRGSPGDDATLLISAAISAAVAGFAGRAGAAFADAAAYWARRLGEQARWQASAAAAQFRRYLAAPSRDSDDPAILADLAGRLAAFQESLAAWVPDATSPAPGPEAEPHVPPPGGVERALIPTIAK
jgi:hypothetical protein